MENNTHDLEIALIQPVTANDLRKVLEARREALLIELYAIEDALGMQRSMTARQFKERSREITN